jgi:hypothetical protein
VIGLQGGQLVFDVPIDELGTHLLEPLYGDTPRQPLPHAALHHVTPHRPTPHHTGTDGAPLTA